MYTTSTPTSRMPFYFSRVPTAFAPEKKNLTVVVTCQLAPTGVRENQTRTDNTYAYASTSDRVSRVVGKDDGISFFPPFFFVYFFFFFHITVMKDAKDL